MNRTDKIWLYGGLSTSLIASMIIAVSFSRVLVWSELALAGVSIKACDLIFGAKSSASISWINQVDNLLMMYNHNLVFDKALSDFVIPSRRDALLRCASMNPIPDNDFSITAEYLLASEKRFASPEYYEDMEYVRKTIVRHWGKDSPKLLYLYGDLLNLLSNRYANNQNDENIEYSLAMSFEACRLARLHNDEQVQWTTSQNLVRLGEYFFVHKQYKKAEAFYKKVLNCVPVGLDYEGHLRNIIVDRISTSQARQAGKV